MTVFELKVINSFSIKKLLFLTNNNHLLYIRKNVTGNVIVLVKN